MAGEGEKKAPIMYYTIYLTMKPRLCYHKKKTKKHTIEASLEQNPENAIPVTVPSRRGLAGFRTLLSRSHSVTLRFEGTVRRSWLSGRWKIKGKGHNEIGTQVRGGLYHSSL